MKLSIITARLGYVRHNSVRGIIHVSQLYELTENNGHV